MNEKELFENAHKLLETHFKIKVDNEEVLNAWKLFKEDYVKQIEENKTYKTKEDKLREYLSNTKFEERTAYDKSFCEGVYNTKEKALKILNEGE